MKIEKRLNELERELLELKELIKKNEIEYNSSYCYLFKNEDDELYQLKLIRAKTGNGRAYVWQKFFGDCYWNGFFEDVYEAIKSVEEENITELKDAQEVSKYFNNR